MNIILKSKFLILVFFSIIGLKIDAQFLDKTYYLVDSIESATIDKTDREFLDQTIKKYRASKSDTAKIQTISSLIEGLQDEKIWIKYNRLLYNTSREKLQTLPDTNSRAYYILKSSEALALNNFGYYYFNYSNRQELALKYYLRSLTINEDIENYNELITSFSNAGNAYLNQGDLNNALIYFQKALKLENKITNKFLLLAPLNNIAQVYYHLNDTVKAIETLKRAFKISSKSDNNFLKGSLLHNIGSLSYYTGDPTGVQTLKKALALRLQIGDKKGTLQTTLSLAGIETKNKNFLMAEKYLDDAGKLILQFPNSNIVGLYYNDLGNYYEAMNEKKLAIASLEKAIAIYKGNFENVDMVKALNNLIDLYDSNDQKYALKKLEAYELRQNIVKNLDKTAAQKLLMKQKYEEDLKINEAKFTLEQQLKDEKNRAERQRQRLILIAVCVMLLGVLVFSVLIFKALKANKQKNKIISDQKREVEHQKNLIEEKHKDITDSITYAHRIQSSLIPTQQILNKQYAQLAILFQPRDIVSGDFYWYAKTKGLNIFALADCTGHGVPGAFMSFIGINQLNTIVNEKEIISPPQILTELKKGVVQSLNSDQSNTERKDGMDVAVICFNEKELHFAGANQSILIIRDNLLIELKGNKQPVGLSENNESFAEVDFGLLSKDRIVLYSDGVVDQFGGAAGKKLKTRHFKAWLVETSYLSLQEQRNALTEKLNSYKGTYDQTDDITLAIIEV
ncbi:MAG: tetratricopeptide repeat protein [Bacteroidota bacterium]